METGDARATLAGFVAFCLSGCAATMAGTAPDQAEAPPVPQPMICNAEAARSHIGHDATQGMGAAILKDSGARSLRWGPPGGAWTMDYRQDRVNVRYDAGMKITEITCG